MSTKVIQPGRRKMLKHSMLALGVAIAGSTAARRALADAPKAAKTAFQYQYKPKDGKKCANCSLYIPGAKGQCKVVEGDISPEGWCLAYVEAPKK